MKHAYTRQSSTNSIVWVFNFSGTWISSVKKKKLKKNTPKIQQRNNVSVGIVPYAVALWSSDLNLKPLRCTHFLTGLNPEDECLIPQITQTVLLREKHPHICGPLWMSAPLISTVFSNSQVSVVFFQVLISCGGLLALLKLKSL